MFSITISYVDRSFSDNDYSLPCCYPPLRCVQWHAWIKEGPVIQLTKWNSTLWLLEWWGTLNSYTIIVTKIVEKGPRKTWEVQTLPSYAFPPLHTWLIAVSRGCHSWVEGFLKLMDETPTLNLTVKKSVSYAVWHSLLGFCLRYTKALCIHAFQMLQSTKHNLFTNHNICL